jgi:FAD/FMN-containing dehydrogenase/Fe-S oxidoreductase
MANDAAAPPSLRRFAEALARLTKAEMRFDEGYRGLYSTDASLYQVEPRGVVTPRSAADLAIAVQLAAEAGLPVLPRGGATSLSGQTVGPAIVLDLSKHLNRIGIVDRDRATVDVEPGVVLDRLNAHLSPLGLMFAPDVSTGDRATIGGMIGNNSAGARSLRYGKTVDHVEALDVVLDDGSRARFSPLDEAELDGMRARSDRLGALHREVGRIASEHAGAIRQRFPRILRRVSGYNLDEFVPGAAVRPEAWPREAFRFNLSRLIVGSEGTLAVVSGARLKVVPKPRAQGLVILSFTTIPLAIERLGEILATQPVAVEMLDRTILELAASQPELAGHVDFALGQPGAVLAAQFYADTHGELEDRARGLTGLFEGRAGVLGVRTSLADAAKDSFWKVRKAGLALLMGMVGDAKPVAFVEDTAVAPSKLPEFHERFMAIVERHEARAACYGHADVGCLHIRPIINVKEVRGLQQIEGIAKEIAELVAEYGGAMSGEHGDGLARSRWNRPLFGEEVYGAFLEVKRAFDPADRLNPGKVVAEPPITANLRLSPAYRAHEPETILDFESQGGFARAVELCSGVGACRKTASGTMCPSYMVTLEEQHTTRGRANALRLALSGQLPDGLSGEALAEALDLCLQCKACKTECPSNVDLAKLKAETLFQQSRSRAVPLESLAMAHLHRLYPIASAVAAVGNALARNTAAKWLLEKLAGIDRRRTLPAFAAENFRHWFRRHRPDPAAGSRGTVLVLDDCFTTYHAPHVGRAAVRLLETAGYSVELAGLACCGRAAVSKGQLEVARELARENVRRLAPLTGQGIPLLGLEPSCLLTFVDEYVELRLGTAAVEVARSSRLVESLLADPASVPDLPLRPLERTVLLHGHCHQKALVGTTATEAALKRIPEVRLEVLDSGCCGMAGSFGYEVGHYDVSLALVNRVIGPALAARPEAILAAPGFSCRSQVHDVLAIEARHPVEILEAQLRA